MKKYGIRKVKTFNGVKYGVVSLETKDVYGTDDKTPKFLAKEIDVCETKNSKDTSGIVLMFEHNAEGLRTAREWQTVLNG